MRNYFFLISAFLVGCGSVVTSATEQPTVTTIAPDRGPLAGGTQITITGTKFEGTPFVVIGGQVATDVSVMNSTTVVATTPEGDQEGSLVDVTVSVDSGFATKTGAFTYNYQPVVLSVSPTIGKGAGGTPITIIGRGFDAGTNKVTIGGGLASSVTVMDDKTLTVMTGAVAAGTKPFTPLDVKVENDNGSTTFRNSFQVTTKGLIATERSGQLRIMHIDLSGTNTVTQLAVFGQARRFKGCVLNPNTGKLFAVSVNNTTQVHELVTFEPLTGAVTVLGPTNDAGNVAHCIASLAFIGNTLFGADTGTSGARCPGTSSRIVTVNTTNGQVTPVPGVGAMTFARDNAIALKDAATLYFADRSDQSLDTIAVGSSVLSTGQPFTGASGAALPVKGLVNVGGTLFLLERISPPQLYTVNQTTAALTRVLTFPVTGTFNGLCETPPTF